MKQIKRNFFRRWESDFNSNKASGPNSIPYRILFFLKNEIPKQLADLFNLSFVNCIFPSVLKTAKVVPVFKKDTKLDCPIVQSSSYQILRKYFKDFSIKDCIPFSIIIILSITYNLVSDSIILHNMPLLLNQRNIRKVLDEGNTGCGEIFADLLKAFDTVDHQILLVRLDHYGIRGVSNDYFK